MIPHRRLQVSGSGQIFKSNEFLCNVTFSYSQIKNHVGEFIRSDGKLLIEESKRELQNVLKDIRHVPVELRMENSEILKIYVFKIDGNVNDGNFDWLVWDAG
jgi:hypothetical protein